MLNLVKNHKVRANYEIAPVYAKKVAVKTSKHFPNSTREWKDSIYSFNKNNLSLIPSTSLTSFKVTKNYLSLFNNMLENKLRKITYIFKLRKWSQNKIFVNHGEFKHTNNKVVINFYLFNRQTINFGIAIETLKKFFFKTLNNDPEILLKRLNLIEQESFRLLNDENFKAVTDKKFFLIKNTKENINDSKKSRYISICLRYFFIRLLKKEYNRTLQYFYFKQMLIINKHKFSYIFLQYLKQHIYKLYNKQVEFNLINLERFYLNSDILLESIIKKITRKRRKVLTFVKKVGDKVSVIKKNSFFHKYEIKKSDEKLVLSKNNVSDTILDKLKYKDVTGLKLQAKGRLTKRYTASRSVTKVVLKGNLLNRDASLKGLSTVILKGNLKSNLQYTKRASKSRIGSFGLKGWINSDQ